MPFLFEDCCLDADRRELKRGSELIPIGPKVFDLLLFLVQNRKQVVTRDDFLQAVWEGRIVSDSTLTSHINAVRKAIGDTGKEQRLIRTVSRKGIRFVGTVQEVDFVANAPDTDRIMIETPDTVDASDAAERDRVIVSGLVRFLRQLEFTEPEYCVNGARVLLAALLDLDGEAAKPAG